MDTYGAYEVIERVASGSTATVYKARHRHIERVAAIKDLHAELRSSAEFTERFRSEAHTLAGFDDEHIVAVYDFVEEPTRSWIAEEWIDGVTIATLLAESGPLTAEQSLGVLRGAMLGLAYAHDRGVVHSDLSPANIIADAAGTSKLIDFGVSAPSGARGVHGTPAFMSPEVVRGEAIGKTSDVYSAGAILYLLLSGRQPFPAPSVEAVLTEHVQTPPPALTGHGSDLAALVQDSMAKDPARRPPDARAFLARLEDAGQDRYGADWLTRASIAGLVAAATGTTAAVASIVGGRDGAGSTVGGPAGADAASVAFSPAVVRTGRRARTMIIGGGVAAVLIVGAVVAFAASGGDSRPRADHKTTAAPGGGTGTGTGTRSSVTSVASEQLRGLAGTYRGTAVITATTNYRDEHVGGSGSLRLVISTTCGADGECTASVDYGGTSPAPLTSSGRSLHIVGDNPNQCNTNSSRTIVPVSDHFVFSLQTTGPASRPTGLTGTLTHTIAASSQCRGASLTLKLTLTRV